MSDPPRPNPGGWQPRQPKPAPDPPDQAKPDPDASDQPKPAPDPPDQAKPEANTAQQVPEVRRPPEPLERVTGLATLAAGAYLHAGSWAISRSVQATKRVAGAMTSPAKAVTLADDVVKNTREILQTIIATGAAQAAAVSSAAQPGKPARPNPEDPLDAAPELLRTAGEDLLRRSRELDAEPAIHPAYARILSELAPDEGRVLQLMLVGGPQPAVDVRGGGIFGFFNTHLVRRGLTMIGARAGLRHADQVPSYLNNLFRLGLIWVAPETIRDYRRYQVLEAQPEVVEAMHTVRYARVVRRSIHLTPFGEDFARRTLPAGVAHPLPEHSDPKAPDTERPAEPADDPFE